MDLEGIKGTVDDGTLTVASEPVEQAGMIKATVGGLTGDARARVVRPLRGRKHSTGTRTAPSPPGWASVTVQGN